MAEERGEDRRDAGTPPGPVGGGERSGDTPFEERSGGPPSGERIEQALARIEAAVASGSTDLGALGFWRVVHRVKLDPAPAAEWADAAGRIDATAFERSVRWRFPVWLGNGVLLGGTGVGALAVVLALRSGNRPAAGLGLVAAAGAWSVSAHGLAHWAVGRANGIRFRWYFFRPGQIPPRPGIKTDYGSYLRAAPAGRASMHAAGALATKVAPFVALAFWPASRAPAWAAWVVLAIGLGQIATDVRFSTRTGDWSKVARERAIARERASGGRSATDG
jgi:hypothetical protein